MEDGGTVVKGKRTKRHRPHSVASAASASAADTNDSPPRADHQEAAASSESNYSRSNGVAATASASASAPVTSSDRVNTEEEEDLANCLIMLAQGRRFVEPRRDQEKFTSRRFLEASPNSANGGYYVYECKTCSKTFPSFQALGGHRASHKKPKLLPATTTTTKDEESRNRRSNNLVLSDDDEIATTTTTTTPDNRPPPAIKVNHSISNNFSSSNSLSLQLTNRALYNSANTTTSTTTGNKQRVHECSICGAEFASGQALGGHMRRHRGPVVGGSQTAPIVPSASLSLTLHVEEEEEEKRSSSSSAVHPVTNALSNKKPSLDLDLNLPAMPDAEEVNRSETKHVFPGKKQPPKVLEGEVQPPTPPPPPPPAAQAQKQQLVFSPPALVDCHY